MGTPTRSLRPSHHMARRGAEAPIRSLVAGKRFTPESRRLRNATAGVFTRSAKETIPGPEIDGPRRPYQQRLIPSELAKPAPHRACRGRTRWCGFGEEDVTESLPKVSSRTLRSPRTPALIPARL